MTVRARLALIILSGFAGWLTAAIVTVPFQILELAQNAGGDTRLLADSIGIGLTIWAIWSLAICIVGILGAGVPIAIWTPPHVLLRHRRRVIGCSLAAGVLVSAIKFHIWKVFKSDPYYDAQLFVVYGVFASVFAGVTAWLYLKLLQNRSASGE